ncbi:hypothetical protein [Corynebacterium sp.]|uniref:hypothetical protein n=1 Tax=Corynebacterium sp. TaxID=1720 RepID=UPI0026DF70A2|nr:hypothetical protein [Corynebacterium sp.]MDO5511945.1 hypothetical protein [Corynebacterium sp.]
MQALQSRKALFIAWVGLALNVILTYLRAVTPAHALGVSVEDLTQFTSVSGPIINVVTVGFALIVALVQRRMILGLAALVSFFSFFVIALFHLGLCVIWRYFFWDDLVSDGSGSIAPFWACQFLDP